MKKSRNKSAIEAAMHGKKRGAAHALLSPLSVLFGAGVAVRGLMYKSGLLKTKTLPCKVISIGNITVGGTGKTPMTIFTAERLKYLGFSVAVLSRGYKRSTTGVQIVSDKKDVLLGAKEAGDEPNLMANRLSGTPVVVGAKRYEAGLEIIERFAPDVILLDDAFQHIRLKRDINILLIDSALGFGSGRLLPAGILREPVSAAHRADIIMIKGGKLRPEDRKQIAHLKKTEFNFSYNVEDFTKIDSGSLLEADINQNVRVLALAALANPGSFVSTIEGTGLTVGKEWFYRDHHNYSQTDLNDIIEAASGLDAIITTEKDAVKLKVLLDNLQEMNQNMKKDTPPFYSIRIGVKVCDVERFDAVLEAALFLDNGSA